MQNAASEIHELFEQFVVPSYARFDLVLERGEGSYVWDVGGRRYLDLGGGIAVCTLGHANPEITGTLAEQSQKLIHVSNLYYTEPQARLAKRIVDLIAPGRVFFCNSGAEANEGLFKLARKFGHDEGRYEIITAVDSFHGRTLAGIAATGQEKVKKGFEPIVPGFKQIPFNDLEAMRAAITKSTAAILIEAIQGESGITIATPEYLVGLRKLCDEHNLLLLLDEVQAGHFRTGKFHSWQRILEDGDFDFLPDGISMAKALGGGFPIGAFWVREKFGGLLSAGTHASTFGGTPLACAVAERILDVIEREDLMANARRIGDFLVDRLRRIQGKYPRVMSDVRGLGLMIGIEFEPKLSTFTNEEKSPAIQIVNRLHEKGVLTVPAATSVIRLLPPLNSSESEAVEGLHAIKNVVDELNG
ncbi:MAG: aspartate aminotransferase family protein [Verrucomicrobia bacterium]|nr:MAG: aspartate aminotransferase family protein [Verrucomicrobiota bacterium]